MTSLHVVRRVSSLTCVLTPALALLLAAGCSSNGGGTQGTGGSDSGGTTGNGGNATSGGAIGNGGSTAQGGITSAGGTSTAGGTTTTGGNLGSAGATSSGGATGKDAGPGSGGALGTGGGTSSGGVTSSGGIPGRDGGPGSGGTSGGTSTTTTDCTSIPAMPSGGQSHSGNSQGGTGNLAWQIWSNAGSGTLTTFSTPAFSAGWNNSGDYLGRLGFEWGNSGKTYDQYGTIAAQVAFKKTGSAGGYSYIGIYGWSTNPCVEYYIVDDSFGTMPFNAYNSTLKGTVTIDGESYKLFSNNTNGTGGSRCNASSWLQFWSIRQKARQCGTITISDHFKAWDAAGMKLGNLLEAKILVETGGGSGSVDFPIANVTKTQ